MEAADLAAIRVGIVNGPHELPIPAGIVYDEDNRLSVLNDTAAYEYALVRITFKWPLLSRKYLIIDVVQHLSGQHVRFVEQRLRSKNLLQIPGICTVLGWPNALNRWELHTFVKPNGQA